MEERFYHIDTQLARELIAKASAAPKNASGQNSDVLISGDYVVLKGWERSGKRGNNICIKKIDVCPSDKTPFDVIIEKLYELNRQGVNVPRILGYDYDASGMSEFKSNVEDENSPVHAAYAWGHVIMEKAAGQEMYDEKLINSDKEYALQRTQALAAAPQKHFDKFVEDYMAITKAGIHVDTEHRPNFFYDEQKGFSFIDLNGLIDDEQVEKRISGDSHQNLGDFFFIPCHRTLDMWDMPSTKDLSPEEFEKLKNANKVIFEKCMNAVIAGGVATKEEIKQYLYNTLRNFNGPKLNIAGLTNAFELPPKSGDREI